MGMGLRLFFTDHSITQRQITISGISSPCKGKYPEGDGVKNKHPKRIGSITKVLTNCLQHIFQLHQYHVIFKTQNGNSLRF